MKLKMRIILSLLLLFSATSAFAQDDGTLVRTYDEGKVDNLINSVKNKQKFKNAFKSFDDTETSVIISWAEELFRQYYKDAKVSFTEADYQAVVAEKQLLEATITRLRNDSTACAADKAKMQAQIDAKDKELLNASNVANRLAESDTKMNALEAVITRLRNDSTSMANDNASKQALLDAKDSEIARLNGQLKEASGKYLAYEAAFKEIKDIINEGYNNKALPIRNMNEDELNAAINRFEATEDLLKTNKVLYNDMKIKVDEMRSWIGLKKTLDDAVAYMEGKYKETERKRLVQEIDNKFKGNNKLTKVQIDEKDAIRKALEDQSIIHDNFMAIINESRKKKALSTNAVIDEIINGLNVYDKGSQSTGRLSDFHVSYRKAFNDFMKELKKGENNPKINGPEELSKYLDYLEEIF